jgi:outer membrane murein-binding lipoprotein Lpp
MQSSQSLSETVAADFLSRALLVIVAVLLATLLLAGHGIYWQYSEFQTERRQYNSQISQLKAEVAQYRSALRSVTPDLTTAQKETFGSCGAKLWPT